MQAHFSLKKKNGTPPKYQSSGTHCCKNIIKEWKNNGEDKTWKEIMYPGHENSSKMKTWSARMLLLNLDKHRME
jgi:hypothetical protein